MNKGYPSSQKRTAQKYQTYQPLGTGRHGADSLMKAMTDLAGADLVPEATSTELRLDLAGHSVKAGHMIRFVAGPLDGQEVAVDRVEANSIYLSHKLDVAITAADLFRNYETRGLSVDADGNIVAAQGPLQYVRDTATVEVTRDTATPANNIPLPVEIIGAAGQDINITAGDINVQNSHTGANPDSLQIGDGTEIMLINASGEAQVSDDTARTTLASILAKIIAAPATEAKQDAAITALGLLGTEVTLAAILAKIIAAPATEAKQDTVIAALAEANKIPEILQASFTASQALTTGARIASLTVPALKVGTELEIAYKNGDTISVYDAAAAGNLLGIITQGGGTLRVNLAAATQIHLQAEGADFTATDLVINMVGKDA